jgi:serine/threonine protein kinase
VKTFADYTVVRELGKGATATVYLAVQKSLNRRVALKVLGGGLATDATFTQRFLREGRIVAKLNHANIVPVYDVGEDDGTLYMAMEYLEGGTLEERRDALTLSSLAECFEQITDALAYAHEQGFVHRDIKLENILYRQDGTAVLGDFGIARSAESLTRMTMTGAILGTPAYMSPEQVAGRELDGRADVYSLGVVLFELLSGHTPYQGDSVVSVGLQHLTAPIPRLPAASSHFQPLVERAMGKKPADRFSDAAEFGDAVEAHLKTFARPPDTPLSALHGDTVPQALDIERAMSATDQKPGTGRWLTGALATVAAASLIAFVVMQPTNAPPETQPAETSVQPEADPEVERVAQEIDALLRRAEAADRDERWVSVDGNGAIDALEAVLALDPENADALAALDRVRRNMLRRAELDIAAGRLADAEAQLVAVASQWPDDADLDALNGQIATRRAADAAAAERSERSQRLAATIDRASEAARRGDWLEPEGDNALALYRVALEIDPGNVIAQNGIDSVAAHFVTESEQSIGDEDFDRAGDMLALAAIADPEHPRIEPVRLRLADAEDAAAERRRSEQAAKSFNDDLERLGRRIDAYINGTEDAETSGYERLSSELEILKAAAPDNLTVQALETALDNHQQNLEAESEEAGDDRFNLPTF